MCILYSPVNSTYYEDDFSNLENEITSIPQNTNILILGDLNARTGEKTDFIENEGSTHEQLYTILPDNYTEDTNYNRNSCDKICNTQGQNLIDLCIASQLRILNGRFIGDILGNFTCHKSYGASVVDYALADMDLLKSIHFFQVKNATYLSDHSQISVHLHCNLSIDEQFYTQKLVSLDYS